MLTFLSYLQFGAGARTCIGKNISLLEMSKLVPQVLRRFDFELAHPDRDWVLHDYWFVTQTGLDFKIKARHQSREHDHRTRRERT